MFSSCTPDHATWAGKNQRRQQVRAAQVRLLYSNARTGTAVTLLAAPALAYFQSRFIPYGTVVAWLSYMFLVCTARFFLARRYLHMAPGPARIAPWSTAFAIGAGFGGAGWGLAGIFLYPEAQLMHQLFVVFVLGGMMLGGASLLAARPEAFLAFLTPAGLLPSLRLLFEPDREHIAMGLLAILFTAALLVATWRLQRTIESSLELQFENRELVSELQIANNQALTLNQQLEQRVLERTAELYQSNLRLRDEIRQREQTEEELLRVRNLESLGVLAGGIAHDFNNFLTIVQGNIELAQMDLDEDSPVRATLQQTSVACRRAGFLSNQLLTFAKGGAPIRRVVSVAELILDSVNLVRTGALVSVDVDIADDLWCAELDRSQIGQVLHNILLNARQAMPEGGIVEVHAENLLPSGQPPDLREQVRISIRDYGPGIPADILPRIFDPYFTTRTGGTGLGLTTAYAIVTRHGGRISVDSKVGQGTVFVLDLPATRERPAPEVAPAARLRRGTGRLLVMDDEEALRMLLERVLTTLGYEVHAARDGAEAIALYESAKAAGVGYDAVLLDLTVSGGMGGVEAAVRLRELDPSARLIVSSGYSDAPVMARFRDYGFDDAIPKPWLMPQLSEVFERVLVRKPEQNTI